jgi:hypothetical protein
MCGVLAVQGLQESATGNHATSAQAAGAQAPVSSEPRSMQRNGVEAVRQVSKDVSVDQGPAQRAAGYSPSDASSFRHKQLAAMNMPDRVS